MITNGPFYFNASCMRLEKVKIYALKIIYVKISLTQLVEGKKKTVYEKCLECLLKYSEASIYPLIYTVHVFIHLFIFYNRNVEILLKE